MMSVYGTRILKKERKKIKGSCFKCLREGNKSADCKRGKMCIFCNEVNSHHRSLCPKKINMKTSTVHFSEELMVNRRQDSVYFDGTPLQNGNTDEQENVFITSSEMVLLQIAKTDVRNVGNNFKQQHVFFSIQNPRGRTFHKV